MKNWQKIILVLALIGTAVLIYSPHFGYRFPFHIDEWYHIEQSIKLGNFLQNLAAGPFYGFEGGFDLLLFILSKFFNLVIAYRFLPAVWGCISALVLFYVTHKKTKNDFFAALWAVVFFASIKSNVNLTGLWFFTPLSFALPFIFLYVYFFTEGVLNQNRRLILASLVIMIILLPVHAISVLFALPALLIFSLFNFRYFLKEYKFFLWFLLVPILGILSYKYSLALPWPQLADSAWNNLHFNYGWGVVEIKNSWLEIYSGIGYLLAGIGGLFILLTPEVRKHYSIYLIWPFTLLILIMIYRFFGVSYLSPYQRNMYYLAISLPLLSAFGLKYLLTALTGPPDQSRSADKRLIVLSRTASILLILVVFSLTFKSYYKMPESVRLYKLINESDYAALQFLAQVPPATVLALPEVSNALYPVAQKQPVGSIYFSGDRQKVENFFTAPDCKAKRVVLDQANAKYVLSRWKMNCGWELIYDKDNNYIYRYQSQNE